MGAGGTGLSVEKQGKNDKVVGSGFSWKGRIWKGKAGGTLGAGGQDILES